MDSNRYAILRLEKISDASELVRSLKHCFREQETQNADPARTPDNTHQLAATVETALAAFEAKLPPKKQRRKNGVIAIEYLITASPEVMMAKSREEVDAYLNDSIEWLRKRHGADNLVVATIHRDETTPHASAFVVPRDPRGKMNARHFCGGVEQLSQMQTDFAETVGAKHGLVRGIEKSGARHQTIRSYYASLRRAESERKVAAEILATQNDLSLMQRTSGRLSQEIYDAVMDRADQIAEVDRLKKENMRLERKVAAQTNSIAKLRAAEVREIRLPTVLQALGGVSISEDERRWSTPRGIVEIDGDNARNFRFAGKKGYNAIDLVMAIDDVSFERAVWWLLALNNPETSADRLAGDAAYAATQRAKLVIEQASRAIDRGQLPAAVDLNRSRDAVATTCANLHALGVDRDLLDAWATEKKIVAAHFGDELHAVFPIASGPKTNPTGWVIASMQTRQEWVRGQKGPIVLTTDSGDDSPREETVIAFTEKTLDAFALTTAFRRGAVYKSFRRLIAIATNGLPFDDLRALVRHYAKHGRAIVAEFARNDRGKTLSGHLTRALKEEKVVIDNKGVSRFPFPENCVYWIDVLRQWDKFLELIEKSEKAIIRRNKPTGIRRE